MTICYIFLEKQLQFVQDQHFLISQNFKQKMASRNRNEINFHTSISLLIKKFEQISDWGGIIKLLSEVLNLIQNNKGLKIPRQTDLAKRLAQCLNPDLASVHENTLQVYTAVFQREIEIMKKEQQAHSKDPGYNEQKYSVEKNHSKIALFLGGLFSFYQHASFENKQKFLALIKDQVLKLENEVILSLPGLLLTMLPALEDQNGEILKKVEEILKDTEAIVGTSAFFGEIWKAMLRTPRSRLSAIKYLDKRIPIDDDRALKAREDRQIHIAKATIQIIKNEVVLKKDEERQKLEEALLGYDNSQFDGPNVKENNVMQLMQYFYYPNKTQLVINALIAGLSIEESQVYVNRATIDFLINHMPINGKTNSDQEKTRLVENVTKAYTKKDFATLNKIQTWLFQHFDEDEEAEVDAKDPTIVCIVESQKNLYKQSMEFKQEVKVWRGQADTTVVDKHQLEIQNKTNNPISILLRIFTDEPNAKEPVLESLAIDLLGFIRNHLSNRNLNELFVGRLRAFLEGIADSFGAVLKNLSGWLARELEELALYMENNDDGPMRLQRKIESIQLPIDLIQFAINDLRQIYKDLFVKGESNETLIHILSTLLQGMKTISNKNKNLELIIPSLEVIDLILKILYSIDGGAMLAKRNNHPEFRAGIDSFNNLYVQMSKKLIEDCEKDDTDVHQQKMELETFRKYNNILLKILYHQVPQENVLSSANQLPEWLEMLIKCSKVQQTKICLVSIDVFIKILNVKETSKQIGGGPITNIQRLLRAQSDKQEPDFADNKEIIQNLWNILENESEIETVIQQLEKFDGLFPELFSNVVIEDLQKKKDNTNSNNNAVSKQNLQKQTRKKQEGAIKRFTVFWKNTAQSYPRYKPFATPLPPNQINAAGKQASSDAASDANPDEKKNVPAEGKKYLALHEMINFLEDPDPTLRLSCRSWLSQSSSKYNRIIDPLIEEFIKYSMFKYTHEHEEIIIDGQIENQYVIQNFSKIRNIILNTQDELIEYMIPRPGQKHIVDVYNKTIVMKKKQQMEEGAAGLQPENSADGRRSTVKAAEQSAAKAERGVPMPPGGHGQDGKPELNNKEKLDEVKYIDILVEITLNFIRAEYPDKGQQNQQYGWNDKGSFGKKPQTPFGESANSLQDEDTQAEALTVNASACEFMELILKQVEKYPDPMQAYEIAHKIIKPLIYTFKKCIEKKDQAMQVNIISLLDLILNHCNFQGTSVNPVFKSGIELKKIEEERAAKCSAILGDDLLIDTIILGLKQDVSFVRQKFIKFVEMFVPYIRKFVKDNSTFSHHYQNHIEKLTTVFCELLRRVDVSFFSSTKKAQQFNVQHLRERNMQDRPFDRRRPSVVQHRNSLSFGKQQRESMSDGDSGAATAKDPFDTLVINQETDIVEIIGGLQCIVNTCLDITPDGQRAQEDPDAELPDHERKKMEQQRRTTNNNHNGFLSQLFGGNNAGYFAPAFADGVFGPTRTYIHGQLPKVLVSCINCWNNLSLFNWNDYHFTRSGMFAFSQEDAKLINKKLRKYMYSRENATHITQEENFNQEANSIQKKIVQLLRPIAKKFPDQFINGALDVWLKKSLLGLTDEDKYKTNVSYEKIIQILICIYEAREHKKPSNKIEYILPVHKVIDSMIKYIQEASGPLKKQKETLVNVQRWVKNNPPLSHTQFTSESLLNSFLFAYIVYNPSMFDPLLERRTEDKQREYKNVYKSMLNYFNVFKLSRNPFTICWILELLNVTTIKYNITDSRLDNNLRKDYHLLLNNILTNCQAIISDTFNIKFADKQEYKLAFPPTVYELLWRYEYMSYKNTIQNEQLTTTTGLNADKHGDQSFQVSEEKSKKTKKEATKLTAENGSVFFDNAQLKQMADQKFEHVHSGGPNKPSIFQHMEILLKDKDRLSPEYHQQSQFLEKIRFAIRGQNINKEDILTQSKFFTIITLQQVLCQVVQNLMTSHEIEKQNKSLFIILQPTIASLQKQTNKDEKGNFAIQIINWQEHELPHINTGHKERGGEKDREEERRKLKEIQDKSVDDIVMNQITTEFFASVIERYQGIDELIRPYRRDVIELFNQEYFFHCQTNKLNIKQWKKIMKYFIGNKPDEMYEEQMQKWSQQAGLFANTNSITQQRCYAMKRIAFLIFSCEDDDFSTNNNMLDQLMKKMIEGFKQRDKKDYKQRIFTFFLTRVLLIRLSLQTLTEALRKLWPHLLNELISVFEARTSEAGGTDRENTDLIIEAIKLVELLSSLNIEDFQMNQWIFLIDGYGMKAIEGGPENVGRPPTKDKDHDTEAFKTFIIRFIGSQEFSFYNVDQPRGGHGDSGELEPNDPQDNGLEVSYRYNDDNGSEDDDHAFKPQRAPVRPASPAKPSAVDAKAGNIFTQNAYKYQSDEEGMLVSHALALQESINASNVVGNAFNRQEQAAKILEDFLTNDDIIHHQGGQSPERKSLVLARQEQYRKRRMEERDKQ